MSIDQIEELAWVLCDIPKHPSIKSCEQCGNKHCHAIYYAERAINAGYRKQCKNTIDLPCKVGDAVYMPWEWNDAKGIACLKVTAIRNLIGFGWSVGTDFDTDDEGYCRTEVTVKEFAKFLIDKAEAGAINIGDIADLCYEFLEGEE